MNRGLLVLPTHEVRTGRRGSGTLYAMPEIIGLYSKIFLLQFKRWRPIESLVLTWHNHHLIRTLMPMTKGHCTSRGPNIFRSCIGFVS